MIRAPRRDPRETAPRASRAAARTVRRGCGRKTPPASILLKKAAGITSGSAEPHVNKVGKVNRAQLEEIATLKMPDLTARDMDAAVKTIAGSARSAGIEVEGV